MQISLKIRALSATMAHKFTALLLAAVAFLLALDVALAKYSAPMHLPLGVNPTQVLTKRSH